MDTEKWFNEKLAALEDDADFRLEEAIFDLTEKISAIADTRSARAFSYGDSLLRIPISGRGTSIFSIEV